MAYVHDYLQDAHKTDDRLLALIEYLRTLEQGGAQPAAVAVCLAGLAIAAAIREAATRADYVARDLR